MDVSFSPRERLSTESQSFSAQPMGVDNSAPCASSGNASSPYSLVAAAEVEPKVNRKIADDADFYYICDFAMGYHCERTLAERDIQALESLYPNLFVKVDNAIDRALKTVDKNEECLIYWDSLNIEHFQRYPEALQPIAEYLYNQLEEAPFSENNQRYGSGFNIEVMPYGLFKSQFFSIKESINGDQQLLVDHDGYKNMLENKKLVSAFHDLAFGDKTPEEKIETLKMMFPPDQPDGQHVSFEAFRTNALALMGKDFKQAQQRAVDSGMDP